MTIFKNKFQLLYRRRELRRKQTKSEEILWKSIRNRKIGVKFRRQYSIGGYILDFYCPQNKLVIEIDGNQHFKKEELLYDKERTSFLEILGCSVLRFKNKEIEEDLNKVLLKIKNSCITKNPLLYKERGRGEVNYYFKKDKE